MRVVRGMMEKPSMMVGAVMDLRVGSSSESEAEARAARSEKSVFLMPLGSGWLLFMMFSLVYCG